MSRVLARTTDFKNATSSSSSSTRLFGASLSSSAFCPSASRFSCGISTFSATRFSSLAVSSRTICGTFSAMVFSIRWSIASRSFSSNMSAPPLSSDCTRSGSTCQRLFRLLVPGFRAGALMPPCGRSPGPRCPQTLSAALCPRRWRPASSAPCSPAASCPSASSAPAAGPAGS